MAAVFRTNKHTQKFVEANKRKMVSVIDVIKSPVARERTECFGVVLNHLGNSRVNVRLENKVTTQAVIRGSLRKKKATPIRTGTVVVLSGTLEEAAKGAEIMAVVSEFHAQEFAESGTIPRWMIMDTKPEEDKEDLGFEFGVRDIEAPALPAPAARAKTTLDECSTNAHDNDNFDIDAI